MSVALAKPQAIAKHEGIEQVEAGMLNLPQVDCPVAHHFGPGIYIREVTMPAGTFAIGHRHKTKNLNVMLTGKIVMRKNGEMVTITAPFIFTAEPGRKVAYVLEDTVWQNIYATEETDIEELESMFLDKSETWLDHEKEHKEFRVSICQPDRDDYAKFLAEHCFEESIVRAISENKEDQIPMPSEWSGAASVRASDIEGQGLFLSSPVVAGTVIAPGRLSGKRTPAGRYVNHSLTPNCVYIKTENEDVYLIARRDIIGCRGGDQGEELTVDYRQGIALANTEEEICRL
tara:strand:+ start:29 stop:892 length:864 start_codon:yes stop_codon:yes gene_type:complete